MAYFSYKKYNILSSMIRILYFNLQELVKSVSGSLNKLTLWHYDMTLKLYIISYEIALGSARLVDVNQKNKEYEDNQDVS